MAAQEANEDPRITRTRDAVLEAASDLLAEAGWEHVTHQRVAERSGYSRSTLYRHWPERIDFLRDLSARAESAAHSAPDTGNLRGDLLAELVAYRTVLFSSGGATLAALISLAEHSIDAQTIRATGVEAGEAPLLAMVQAAVAGGALHPEVDGRTAACELFGPITHGRLMNGHELDERQLAALVDGFLERHAAD